MARKVYNGYTPAERRTVALLFRKRISEGLIDAPQKTRCDACDITSQDGATIEWHREDYSRLLPVITICYRCHRVIHLRDRYPEGWAWYCTMIRDGYQWTPTHSISRVCSMLASEGAELPQLRPNHPRPMTVLDQIESGFFLDGTPETRRARLYTLISEEPATLF